MSAEMASENGATEGHGKEAAAVASASSECVVSPLSNGASPRSSGHSVAAMSASTLRSPSEQMLIARGRDLLTTYQRKKLEQHEMLKEMCFSSTMRQEPIVVDIGLSVGSLANGVISYATDIDKSRDQPTVKSLAHDEPSRSSAAPSSIPASTAQHRLYAQNTELLNALERQLNKLWELMRGEDMESSHALAPIRQGISQLLQQKRVLEATLAQQFARGPIEESGGDPTDPSDEMSPRTNGVTMASRTSALQRELNDAKAHIVELNNQLSESRAQWNDHTGTASSAQLNSHNHDGVLSNGRRVERDELRRLYDQLQEKEELLQSLRLSLERVVSDEDKLQQQLRRARSEIERLSSEKSQVEKAASDKRTLLRRAYAVKAKQLDQLCRAFDLPPSWERVTDENGIIYFRRNDRACAPELEDPRVSCVLEHIAKTTGPPSPRSAAGRMENTVTSPMLSATRKRGSWSSSSFDSTVSCDDIPVPPPDDGVPHHVEDFETPLPEGWEMRVTTGGSVFFVNRDTNVTTWRDPRSGKRSAANTVEKERRRSSPVASLRVEIPRDPFVTDDIRRRSFSVGDVAHSSAKAQAGDHDALPSRLQRFDVVFEERGPIGIHFQANHPDAGATVRRLLPRMAAARSEKIEVFDRLVAVNQHDVGSATFRHIMLLLQGGLRPLTLTFERGTRKTRRVSSVEGDVGRRSLSHTSSGGVIRDQAVFSEQDPDAPSRDRTSSAASNDSDDSSYSSSSVTSSSIRDEDLTIADRIITNVFSLFWTPPEHLGSQVQTV
ncbi:hypothetical protein PINS_up000722 [Pythium insidiosum]|nr:hypothetical protein PINS_up000722 [Pythium insidiosum]